MYIRVWTCSDVCLCHHIHMDRHIYCMCLCVHVCMCVCVCVCTLLCMQADVISINLYEVIETQTSERQSLLLGQNVLPVLQMETEWVRERGIQLTV